MGNLTYTVTTGRPRVMGIRSADLSGFVTRSTSGSSWDGTGFYDCWSKVVAAADGYLGQTDTDLTTSSSGGPESSVDDRFLTLGMVGWVLGDSSYHNKLKSAALSLANNSQRWSSWPVKRDQVFAMAWAYDFLRTGVITFSEADRKTIGDELISQADYNGTNSPNEYIDGHTRGNYCAILHAMLALHGESGSGYNYTSTASSRIATVINFWYGASAGAPAAIETERYCIGDGGQFKGIHYSAIAAWHAFWFLRAVSSGFVRNSETPNSLLQLGDEYEPWTDETWIQKYGEWWLRAEMRGDGNFLKIGDSDRITSPWIHENHRWAINTLIKYGGAWRGRMRWLWEELYNFTTRATSATPPGAGQTISTQVRVYDFMQWDPADSGNPVQTPQSQNTPLSRLFDPPGQLFHQNSFVENEKCLLHIQHDIRFFEGHTGHAQGAMQIYVKGDGVLINSGRLDNGDSSAQFGGIHHKLWYQQGISHSGSVLVEDRPVTGFNSPHVTKVDGTYIKIVDGLGGPRYKAYDPGGGDPIVRDPGDIGKVRFDAGGLAWLKTGDVNGNGRFKIQQQVVGKYLFAHCDARRAYLSRAEYYDLAPNLTVIGGGGFAAEGSGDRFQTTTDGIGTGCEFKYLIIDEIWQWPIILQLVRINTRDARYIKRQVWHFGTVPNFTNAPSGGRRISANGKKNIGKCVIDVYQPGLYTISTVGTNTVIQGSGSIVYYQDQFSYTPGTSNWKPTDLYNPREQADIGVRRVDVRVLQDVKEHTYLNVIFPCLIGETPPVYNYVDTPSFLGIDFNGAQYLIHKSQIRVQTTSDTTEDTTAPGVVANPTAIGGPGSGKVTVGWSPNPDADEVAKYKIFYREKV